MTGRKLGSYEIGEKLGEGGMGTVWRARDTRLNRSVAIKMLPADVAGDPVRRQRFEQEALSLGALNHPNIVAIYDVGQSDGQAYIVSELVEGESLRSLIERGPVTGRKLIEIATQTAEAMAAAHALGIVHRDLKPENIMLTGAKSGNPGRVKVLDFGLAKQNTPPVTTEETATIVLSQPGMVLGTVGYMSPEQVRGELVDARSDIFAFGCVLYEMATGRHAFEGKSAADVMSAVLREEPREISGPLPPALDSIVHRCLEKDPAQRFQSAADLAFALRSMTNASGTVAAPKPVAPKRNWLLPLGAAAAAIALFAAGYYLRSRAGAAGPPEFQRLTFREGHITAARFTPDGQNVIYSAVWEGGPPRLYFGTPGSPETRDLEAPQGSRLLAVSSKGDMLLLTSPFTPDGAGTLARGMVAGGQSRAILENVLFADWSPDGSEMALVRRQDGISRLEYPAGKVLFKSEWLEAGIRVSPDGQRVAFATFDKGSAIRIESVDRSGTVQDMGIVSGQITEPGLVDLVWSRDGREVWFRSFDGNSLNTISAVDGSGKTRVVARYPAHVSLYDVTADGRMLLSTDNGRVGIRGVAPGEIVERDLSCLESGLLRDITPDGSIVLANILGESGGAKGSIYWRKSDGSPPVRLSDGHAFAISPDGKWVSGYLSREGAARNYVLIPTGPGENIPVTFPQLQVGVILAWLPGDGNYLVGGVSKSGKWGYFAWNRPANILRPASMEGMEDGETLLVSPDDRQLVATTQAHAWMLCTIETAACTPIPGLSVHDHPIGWRQDGKNLYVAMHHDENRMFMLSLVDVATGQRTPWKEIHPGVPVDSLMNLKITPDGRAYAYAYQYARSDLYIAK